MYKTYNIKSKKPTLLKVLQSTNDYKLNTTTY